MAAGQDENDLMPLFCIPLRDVRGVEYATRPCETWRTRRYRRRYRSSRTAGECASTWVQLAKLRARYQKERWFLTLSFRAKRR